MRVFLTFVLLSITLSSFSQEAHRRWRKMNQIRNDKFDLILPEVMKENQIDMWIIMNREGNFDPLYPDMGEGYVGSTGYYVFTDNGDGRIERAALGISGYLLKEGGAYDHFGSDLELKEYVAERDPQRIGLNFSKFIGGADGLSHSGYKELAEVLGEKYEKRFVSAEKLVSDFRSRRVASEIAAYGEACELSYTIAEKALSNAVITPGITTLEDVAWWIKEQQFKHNLESSFGMPSVYITGPRGIIATSTDKIIERGDVIMLDYGVGLMNMYTDMKRIAYVLREGETSIPEGIQNAFDQGVKVRDIIKKTIKPLQTSFPKAPKTAAAQMDFCRGIRQLSELRTTNRELMENYLEVNSIVAKMNGESVTETQYPWIILGTGNMAEKMGECLRRNAYPIQGVFSTQQERATNLQRKLNAKETYNSLDDIPQAQGKTIAYVASVNDKHYSQVKTLLSKGYDVLCEKPLTMLASQTEELFRLAESKNLKLQENLWSLFLPSAPIISKKTLPENQITLSFTSGIPYAADARQWQPEAGGCLYDLGIYPLAWAVYFLGNITDFNITKSKTEHGIVSHLELTTRHASGKSAVIKTGFHSTEQYIKVGKEYFTPIYAPEYRSSIGNTLARKVREKLVAPEYPAKDPYAFVLNQLNSTETDSRHPADASIHIAQIMEQIHEQLHPVKDAVPAMS